MEQSITNGFGQAVVQAQPNTLGGFIYSRNTYNELGQLTQQNVDGQAPVLYAYDAMGNVCRQTVLLDAAAPEDATQNRILNRPVRFESADGSTIITADYDYMGRRVFKKVESVNEGTTTTTTTSHLRFLYRGYLQIAALDLTRPSLNAMWFITWDPTQPVATRPLAIQKDGTWYTYGWDLTKNICEVYGSNGYIAAAYSYTPYGSATANGYADQPIQWSSEYNNTEPGTNTYNRNNFNIHGGFEKGSGGCIDVGKNDTAFFEELKKYGDALYLYVDYSKKKSAACQKCSRYYKDAWING